MFSPTSLVISCFVFRLLYIHIKHDYFIFQVDFRLDEATVWDPHDAFIDNLATKIFYIVPAFICGVLVGTIIWAFYILIFKFSNGCVKNSRNSRDGNRSHRDSSAKSETNSTSANSIEVT